MVSGEGWKCGGICNCDGVNVDCVTSVGGVERGLLWGVCVLVVGGDFADC